MRKETKKRIKVLVVFGTRPEVIKLAPVIEALRQPAGPDTRKVDDANAVAFEPVICFTGQHREMVEPFLEIFDLKPDYDLHVMQENQPLAGLTARLLVRLDKVLEAEAPDWVIVQGDTTTAMAASLAAFYRKIKVGHVEAGLRTEDKYNPFPEEINRRLISHLADLHFAPTPRARENLLREGLNRRAISVTGNTVVDALHMILKKTEEPGWSEKLKGKIKEIKRGDLTTGKSVATGQRKKAGKHGATGITSWLDAILERGRTAGAKSAPAALTATSSASQAAAASTSTSSPSRPTKLILVTAHRRESFGEGMERICEAIRRVVSHVPEAEVIFPVHLNPNVRSVVLSHLSGLERVHLVEPLDYLTFVYLMQQADLILTDSGGIQEEAPSLGVPVIVMRDKTERPEAVEAGVAWLGGTDPEKIERLALTLLKKVESGEFRRGLKRRNPFGDGHAAARIVTLLKNKDSGT
ncbi:MAG TPA: UDP-N-acetylglucosamine 2-epimerase (non-hydrolyzing) [Candidatus Saccharicenans sp.]|nr:UDP-N-acetylglucosamine 2-epimerase (non-hydrolyzing) [Candidatus Saccharicenans sp.]